MYIACILYVSCMSFGIRIKCQKTCMDKMPDDKMPENIKPDKMPDNPYPNPHPKPHPNGCWFSSVSLFLSTHTLSPNTHSLYLSTQTLSNSLSRYMYTLSPSPYILSIYLSLSLSCVEVPPPC